MKKVSVLILLFIVSLSYSQVKNDTIDIDSNKLLMRNLKNQELNYLVSLEKPNGDLLNASIWTRKTEIQGEIIIISQKWRNTTKQRNKLLYSILKSKNFAPIYHKTTQGSGTVKAFNFYKHKIEGSDSIKNNTEKDFLLEFNKPAFNWELDLEFLQTLPYKLNTNFVIKFYHPGGKSNPKYYNYTVIGREKIVMTDGRKIKSWVLKINYSKNNSATFWIGAKNRQVLRVEEISGPFKAIKTKLYNS